MNNSCPSAFVTTFSIDKYCEINVQKEIFSDVEVYFKEGCIFQTLKTAEESSGM